MKRGLRQPSTTLSHVLNNNRGSEQLDKVVLGQPDARFAMIRWSRFTAAPDTFIVGLFRRSRRSDLVSEDDFFIDVL
jgi:hypothetical protein